MSTKNETMPKKDLEQLFTAIKGEIDQLRDEMSQRLDMQDKKMQNILDIVKTYDQERKEVKSTLWEHDRRILNIEREIA